MKVTKKKKNKVKLERLSFSNPKSSFKSSKFTYNSNSKENDFKINNNLKTISKNELFPESKTIFDFSYQYRNIINNNTLIPNIMKIMSFINTSSNNKNNISSFELISTINAKNENNVNIYEHNYYNKKINNIFYSGLNNLKKRNDNKQNYQDNNEDNIEKKICKEIINFYELNSKNKNINIKNNIYFSNNNLIYQNHNLKDDIIKKQDIKNYLYDDSGNNLNKNIPNINDRFSYINQENKNNNTINNIVYNENDINHKSSKYTNINNLKWMKKLRKSNIDDFSIIHNISYDIQRVSNFTNNTLNTPYNKIGYFNNNMISHISLTVNKKPENKSCEIKLKKNKKKKKKIKKDKIIENYNKIHYINDIKPIIIVKKLNNNNINTMERKANESDISEFKINSKYNKKSQDKRKRNNLKRTKTNENNNHNKTKNIRTNKSFDNKSLRKKNTMKNQINTNIKNTKIKNKSNIRNKNYNQYNNNFTKKLTYNEYFGNQNNSLLDKLKEIKAKLEKTIIEEKEN